MPLSTSRRQKFERQFQKYPSLEILRIPAVSSADVAKLNLSLPVSCSDKKPEELGCILSHIKAIYTAYKNNETFAVIAEDDVVIKTLPSFSNIIENSPPDWEILKLHATGSIAADMYLRYFDARFPFVSFQTHMWGTVIYLINKRGMTRILSSLIPALNSTNLWAEVKNIDLTKIPGQCLADYVLYHMVKSYLYTRPFFTIDSSNDSSIHPEHYYDQQSTARSIAEAFSSWARTELKKFENPNYI